MKEKAFSLFILVAVSFVSVSAGQDFAKTSPAVSDPSKTLSASAVDDWRTDLHYLGRTLETEHANLFHRLDRGKYKNAVKELDSRLPTLSAQQVALESGRIVGMARDGHTYLSTIWDPKLKFQFVPIRFYVFTDGVYVTQAAEQYKDLLGARLTKVEGMAIETAVKKIGPYMSSDNEFGIKEYAPYYLASPSVLKALGISKKADLVTYEFERRGELFKKVAKLDAARDNSIAAVSKGADKWADIRASAASKKPLTFKYPDKGHWFEFVKDKKLLFVQMNNVVDGKDKTIEQFFGEVVAAAKTNGAERLVLDLRHNGGGNNTLVRPIIRGLIQLENIDKKGNLFVIIGRKTFSAAQNLVNQLESWTNASFVGEPTGSHVNMYGDARTFNLPKSGLRLRISELYWQNKHARDERKWTAPNVAAEPNFADYKNNIDPAMRAIEGYSSKPTLLELALKRQATMDLAGFRTDAIAYKNDPANKYADIEAQINRFGYNMINAKQFDAAIGLFKINVELYPDSWNVFDSLAEAHMLKGNKDEAVKLYKKSLAMNPNNANAVKMLERIAHGAKEKKAGDH